jgi:hypothetical protein
MRPETNKTVNLFDSDSRGLAARRRGTISLGQLPRQIGGKPSRVQRLATDDMPLHLVKLAVGIADPEALRRVQAMRRHRGPGGTEAVAAVTRRRPRRVDELLAGGSLYWVIRGQIRVRQRLLGLKDAVDGDGAACCRLQLDPGLVATVPASRRAFQGWRYLTAEEAPPDAATDDDALPPDLAAELDGLGLR